MRLMIFTVAAATIGGGAYVYGHGHSYDGIVHKPPSTVYSAFSESVGFDDAASPAEGLPEGPVTREVTRVAGKSIIVALVQQERPLFKVAFNFEPADGGASTHMTADLDIDLPRIRRELATTKGGDSIPYVPEALVRAGFARYMSVAARQIEQGETLASIGPGSMGVPMRPAVSPSEARWEAEMAQQRASAPTATARPMASAAPMVDANPDHRYGYR
jgi:hypothetical protein